MSAWLGVPSSVAVVRFAGDEDADCDASLGLRRVLRAYENRGGGGGSGSS